MQERGSTVINGNRGLYGDSVLQTTNSKSKPKRLEETGSENYSGK
jgi:hypothetical protein